MKAHVLIISLLSTAGPAMAQEYPQQMTISQSVAAGAISDEKAVETIMASNGVSDGSVVVYTAGKSVTLQPGFVAQAGSVFTATTASIVSSRSVDNMPGLSVRAYPNPFQEQTTIEYNLPTVGRVKHTLMNGKGQILRQSEETTDQLIGKHQTQIEGNGLPTGIYIYKVQIGTESRTVRLLKKQ